MFASFFTLIPGPVKSFFMVVAMVIIASTSTAGTGHAIEDPNVEIPTSPYSERCQRALTTFHQEIDWILEFMERNPDFDPDDPELAAHRDRMWRAWEIAEFECGVDVGGDGEIG